MLPPAPSTTPTAGRCLSKRWRGGCKSALPSNELLLLTNQRQGPTTINLFDLMPPAKHLNQCSGQGAAAGGGSFQNVFTKRVPAALISSLVSNLAEPDRRAGQAELQPSTSGADGRLCSKRRAPRGTVQDAKTRRGAHEAFLAHSVVAGKPVLGIKWVALGCAAPC